MKIIRLVLLFPYLYHPLPHSSSLSHSTPAKFFGSCNLEKVAIDKCFSEEKKRKQAKNRINHPDDGFKEYLTEYRKNPEGK
jgi:hypothetical protein